MTPWPHQQSGFDAVVKAIDEGCRHLCLTAPPRAGKSVLMGMLAKHYRRAIVYNHMIMLTDQLHETFEQLGLNPGVRAATWEQDGVVDFKLIEKPIQIASIQTENNRVLRQGKYPIHDCNLAIFDEAHRAQGSVATTLKKLHMARGTRVLDVTATPVGLDESCEKLIVCTTNSELRALGAHVPCWTYAPNEPDQKFIGKVKTGEQVIGARKRAIYCQQVYGSLVQNWSRLQQRQPATCRATLLFAPDIASSKWFAEKCHEDGIAAAHLDGQVIYYNACCLGGERTVGSSRVHREALKRSHRQGDVRIVCNRFVLREAIDWPWVGHVILATVFGSLHSYIQAGSRCLTADPERPEMAQVICQDHGGNWWRYGSLQEDREWFLGCTMHRLTEERYERFREKKDSEPIVCPKCGLVKRGDRCLGCGYAWSKQHRQILQVDGSLQRREGVIFRPRRIDRSPNVEKKWKRYYHRAVASCHKGKPMTFRQVAGLFAYENNWKWPPRNLPLQPLDDDDWFRRIDEVPKSKLRSV